MPCPPTAELHANADAAAEPGELVRGIYAKYWIYVCAGMFIGSASAGRLVVYKIVYMLPSWLCLTLFQARARGAEWRGAGAQGATESGVGPHHRPHRARVGWQVYYSLWRSCSRHSGGWWWPIPCWCCGLHLPVPGLPAYWAQPDGFSLMSSESGAGLWGQGRGAAIGAVQPC